MDRTEEVLSGPRPVPPERSAYTPEALLSEGEGALWEYHSDTNLLFVYGSRFIKQVYGLDTGSIVYDFHEYVRRFCDDASQGILLHDIKAVSSRNTDYNNVHHVINTRSGKSRVIHACGITRVFNRRVTLCGVAQDITDNVGLDRADLLFVEAKKRAQVLLDTSPTACVFSDEQMVPLDCNRRAIELFQCRSKQEFLAEFRRFSPDIQPDGSESRQKQLELLRRVMETGREETEFWYKLRDGRLLPAEITLVRVPWAAGYCVAGHIRDMRPIFASREKERELEDRYLTMLNATPLSCMLWDKECGIIDCNAESVRLYGADSKAELLENFFDFSPEQQEDGMNSGEKARIFIKEAYRSGRKQFEWTHRAKSGELFPTEITLVRVRWKDDYCIASYARDLRQFKARIREIEEAQRYLVAARERAEKNAQAKNEFLANVSHELRTPMNAVIGMTQLLLRAAITDKQRFYVETIDKSAQHLLRTINDILDFAKTDAGKMTLENAPFSLQKFLGDLIDSVMPGIEEKRLGLRIRIDPAIPDTLLGDSFRLTQVLLNLFSNAVKFTRKGEIRLALCLKTETETGSALPPEKTAVEFSLSDTGIGLNAEQIQGLFKPFSQADSSITRRYGGTGLGLAICKNIVTLMGGAISCRSSPGAGTSFCFTIALDTARPQKLPAYRHAKGKRMFALIDSETARTSMEAHCRIFDCTLTVSTDKEHWEIPEGTDFILVSWADIRFQAKRIKEKVEKVEKTEKGSVPQRPGIIVAVSNKEDPSFLNSLDSSFYLLYKPVTINAFYGHIEEIIAKKTASESPAPAVSARSDLARATAAVRGARVLLVEDNEINQLMASELLTMGGLRVDIACNGREAVEMTARNRYDIVLMDIQMPEMDGLTATRIIRESANTVPILALTAHALAVDREKSLEAGMNDHITKPIDHAALFTALARWIQPPAVP